MGSQILLVRHAIAEDREEFAKHAESDELRPLTEKGRRKMRKNIRSLKKIIGKLELVASSPLVRAHQTAEILRLQFPKAKFLETESLKPGADPKAFVTWQRQQKTLRMAVVGHEPHLSELASYLIAGTLEPIFYLKKGGMCLLEFDGRVSKGSARLQCLLQPAQLRAISRKENDS